MIIANYQKMTKTVHFRYFIPSLYFDTKMPKVDGMFQ